MAHCRAQKSVETALTDLNMTTTPDMPTRETCGAWLALRREIIELQDLKRKVQVRADGAGSVGPEGRGKRTHKGKVARPCSPSCWCHTQCLLLPGRLHILGTGGQ